MSEAEELRQAVNNVRDNLLTAALQAEERAKLGRINADRANKINTELEEAIQNRDYFRECINYMVQMYKNIEQYANDRKELSLEMLKTSITKAGYIVPDADINGVELKVTDKKAKVVNKFGQDINMREGSAYRTVMGMLIRYTLLKAQPDTLQVVLLDEAFGTLSENTISALREYIEIFKEDTLILGIEQHDSLFSGMASAVYRAVKGEDGVTVIRKEL